MSNRRSDPKKSKPNTDRSAAGRRDEARRPSHQARGSEDRLEGRNPIREACAQDAQLTKMDRQAEESRPDRTLSTLIADCREAGAIIIEVDRTTLDKMSESHGHQGIIAHVASHQYADLEDVLAKADAEGRSPFLILLDGLQESYNLGSVLRIADAAGVDAIIIPERRSVALDAVVAKASAGAIEYVPVVRVVNMTTTVIQLKELGFWVYGMEAGGQQNYHQMDWQGKIALVVGSEGSGIGPKLQQHCDALLSIPMSGNINSLNAAVATGVVVFEAMHQRKS